MNKSHLLKPVSTFMLILGAITTAQANLVFEDDFSSGMLPDDWVTVHGQQWIEDGWLHTKGSGWPRDSLGKLHDGDTTWRNYTFKTLIDPLEGPESPWTSAKIIFRSDGWDGSSAGKSGLGYELTFANVIAPGIRGDGPVNRIGLGRYGNGNYSFGTLEGNWGSDPFDITIKAVGAHITVTMDGQTLFDVMDPDPLRYGGIGVWGVWESESRYDYMPVTLVPIPAATWLFGTGLLGLMGMARRKKA